MSDKEDPALSQTLRIDILSEDWPSDPGKPPQLAPHIRLRKKGDGRREPPEQGAQFQELFQRIYDGALITQADGRVILANARGLEFLHLTAEQIGQISVRDIISGADSRLLDTISRNLELNRFTLLQAYCYRQDGSVFPAEIAVSRLDLAGQRYMCFFVRDITLRRAAEKSLRDERNLLRTLIDRLPEIILFKDLEGRIVIGNNEAARLFGLAAAAELVGCTDSDLLPPELAQRFFQEEHAVLTRGQPLLNKEELIVVPPRPGRLLLTNKIPLTDRDGQIDGLVVVSHDITEQRMLENQRLNAQKMESIGQLAAGIAHEINTPVQYIGDNIGFLQKAFGEIAKLLAHGDLLLAEADPALRARLQAMRENIKFDYLINEIPEALGEAREGVRRVAEIVQAMKVFSHPDKAEKTPTNLNLAIQSTVTVSRNVWKYVSEMKLDLAPDLPMVPCHEGHFNQVILNLIVNAADAVREAGGRDTGGKGLMAISTRLDGDWVEIRVADTGTGIAPANRHRIFEPFFTTKEAGKGTGQGLATCHAIIVKKMNGTIAFDTEEGRGTTFIIRLPLKDK